MVAAILLMAFASSYGERMYGSEACMEGKEPNKCFLFHLSGPVALHQIKDNDGE